MFGFRFTWKIERIFIHIIISFSSSLLSRCKSRLACWEIPNELCHCGRMLPPKHIQHCIIYFPIIQLRMRFDCDSLQKVDWAVRHKRGNHFSTRGMLNVYELLMVQLKTVSHSKDHVLTKMENVLWLIASCHFFPIWGSAYGNETKWNVIKTTERENRTENWLKMKLDQHHFPQFHLQHMPDQLKMINFVFTKEENSINRNEKMDKAMQLVIPVGSLWI